MKTAFFAFLSLVAVSCNAFTGTSPIRTASALQVGYVPDGMSPEQWKKLQAKEKSNKDKKNFAAFGPLSFKSRSLQSFQKEMEKGKASHLMPVFNAKEQIKAGKIRQEDIPYMQRGGSWDNSDVKTAKKIEWTKDDEKYVHADRSPAAAKKKGAVQKPTVPKLFGLF